MKQTPARQALTNPVLLLVTGLCPVLVPSYTLQNGLIMGLGVSAHAIFLAALVPVLPVRASEDLRFYFAMAASGMFAAFYGIILRVLVPAETAGLSPYIAFIAMNCFGLSVLRGSLRQGGLDRLPGYAKSAGVLLLTWILFAAVRELLGAGTITLFASESTLVMLDLRSILRVPVRMALFPSGAFLLLGYVSAVYRRKAGRRKG